MCQGIRVAHVSSLTRFVRESLRGLLVVVGSILILATLALAQTPAASPAPTPTPVEPTVSPSPEPAEVPLEFATPRASLVAFMTLMGEGGTLRSGAVTQALTHLDLSAIPTVVREEEGVPLARRLFRILQASELNLSRLDSGLNKKRVTVYQQPEGHAVVMERRSDGRWLVSSETIAVIPAMHQVLTDKGRIQVQRIEALNFAFLGLDGEQWAGLVLLPLIGYLLGALFTLLTNLLSRRLLQHVPFGEEMTRREVMRPLGWAVSAFVVWVGLPELALPSALLMILIVLVKISAALALIRAAFRLSDAVSDYASTVSSRTESKFDDMLIPLARRIAKVFVAFLGLLFLAQNLNIEVWSLFAGFSIFGAMVALAGQDMVKNVFGSITVFTDRPFRVGDYVKVEGTEGVVEDVGFRSTRMRSPSGSVITFPNSRLLTAAVDNQGVKPYRVWTRRLQVPWNTPPDKLEAFCEGVRELVRRHPYTSQHSYQVWVHDLTDFATEILVEVFWLVPDRSTELREKHRFLIDVLRLASDLEIELSYPRQQVIATEAGARLPTQFTLTDQEQAEQLGKSAVDRLLRESLPKAPPPPALMGEGLLPKDR